ncbi:hypothetical protein P8452_64818 [Trifolium repens]|nr:hypothetical protein P8452_64818 [Trifolium repens]
MIEDQQVDDFAYQEDFPYQNSGGISVDIDLPTTLLDSEGRFDEVSESDDDDHGLINDNVIVDNNIDDNEEYAEEEMMDNESDEDEGFSDQSNNELDTCFSRYQFKNLSVGNIANRASSQGVVSFACVQMFQS